jgi:hypothetical protein
MVTALTEDLMVRSAVGLVLTSVVLMLHSALA